MLWVVRIIHIGEPNVSEKSVIQNLNTDNLKHAKQILLKPQI